MAKTEGVFGAVSVTIVALVQGHNPWPDASKWTDKELGIPAELDLEEMEVE